MHNIKAYHIYIDIQFEKKLNDYKNGSFITPEPQSAVRCQVCF